MNNQRMLNRDFGISVHQMNFLADFRLPQIKRIIETTSQTCPTCLINKKTHYCVEPRCQNYQLICYNCQPNNKKSQHFLHQFSYVLPLFCKNIYDNFLDIKNSLMNFEINVEEEITKIKSYLQQMEHIQQLTQNHIQTINKAYESSNFENLVHTLGSLSQKRKHQNLPQFKLKDIMRDIKFYSAQECHKMEEKIIQELISKINELKLLENPQKQFKTMLQMREEELKRDLFLSSRKKIEVSQIDHFFKLNSQFFTESMRTHRVQLKLQSQFLNKPKFYEALVYHLKDVESLCIDNAHMNQIRTPLTFRNLRELQFNCNTETENFNLRIENVSDQLKNLKIRKIREEDIKILKTILSNCINLKQLHLEFYNKIDLSTNKELAQLFMGSTLCNMESLYLKLRTEGEVKRMYGYLSKFSKESSQSNNLLNNALQQFMKKNKSLKRIVIEGIKPLMIGDLLQKMQRMKGLVQYRLYYDNIDLMAELDTNRVKNLDGLCTERKKIVYGLGKALKEGKCSSRTMRNICKDLLM